jgi:hypothetical protein
MGEYLLFQCRRERDRITLTVCLVLQVLPGDFICIGPPGGSYVAELVPGATGGKPVYTTTALPAKETPPGTIKNCGNYYNVVSKDYGQMIAMDFSITFDIPRTMKPQLDADCSNLWANASYCVATICGSTLTPASVLVQSGDCYLTLSPISDNFIVDVGVFGDCDQASIVVDIGEVIVIRYGVLIGQAVF